MKVYVFTGVTSGVGRRLIHRTLKDHSRQEPITLCVSYRNQEKFDRLQCELLSINPKVKIDSFKFDLQNPQAVVSAAREMREKYDHIDCIYLNAGVMHVGSINWPVLWSFSLSKLFLLFTAGVGFLSQSDGVTSDGLQRTFLTNTASHYIIVKELQPLLEKQEQRCQIIWSGSRTSIYGALNPNDVQNRKCRNPYYTSKQAIDVLSVELNKQLNSKGIYSDVICPGVVMTQLTYAFVPKWLWWFFVLPLLLTLRLVSTTFTLFPWNGAEAHMWLRKQNPSSLDHTQKYCSGVDHLWRSTVTLQPHVLSNELAAAVVNEVESIASKFT